MYIHYMNAQQVYRMNTQNIMWSRIHTTIHIIERVLYIIQILQ
jgi:hypothetical protein